jgi:hypothetical protein
MPVKYTGRKGKLTIKGRQVKFTPYRRKAKGKMYKRIKTGYKGTPNQYSFIRETRPITIDLGDNASPGVTLIAGTGAIPNISVFQFPGFQINQLAGGFSEFSALFANYKVLKIETCFVPQWSQNTQQSINPQTGVWSHTGYVPNLMLTRVNTKWLINGLTLSGTAEAQRDVLAQIQKKSRTLYGTKKWLKINTINPRVIMQIEDGSGGQNEISKAGVWLSSLNAADQEFQMNDVLFADKLDGSDFSVGLYKYRMYHRIHFRTSFVG